jgi:signal transduction histidine kinase
MTLLRSLRSRLLLGSVLWTLGMLPVAHVLSISLIIRFPSTLGVPRVIFIQNPAHQGDVVRAALLHYGVFLVPAVVFMVAGLLLIRSGLSPMKQLRSRLAAVHDGRQRRVDGSYPTEVQPLVDDLNLLLDGREEAIRRAIAKAGDLAHGLKTPLAVLSHEAERARAAGHAEWACALSEQVERMRRQMDYHLAHARAAASGATPGTQSPVAASAAALARTLQRLYAERGIKVDVCVATDHVVRVQREDLDEMIGNLLDNACKWAKSRVRVRSEKSDSAVVLIVDDDGPGLPPSLREKVLQRGVRADEAAPGSGFGLAIVRDVAELYAGSVALAAAPLGGLRAMLRLPAAGELKN